MPGFRVNSLGDPAFGVSNQLKPYYTYTWRFEQIGPIVPHQTEVFLRDCTLPTFAIDKEEVEGASLVYKHASVANWDDVRVTFYDIPGNKQNSKTLAEILIGWRNMVWTSLRGVGMPDDYKQPSFIRLHNADDTSSYVWTLVNSWPQTVRDGELSYTTSDVKIVEVTLCYDWATAETGTAAG